MKIILLISFVIISQFIQSQNLPDNFKVGDYVEIFDNDSILVYLSCTGTIVNKDCAQFIRKGKIDSINCNVSGEFFDYDINGNLFLKAYMKNDFLNGVATYYHSNGKVKAKGNYLNNIKQGVWTYYYPNGQMEKVINFVNGNPLIAEYYSQKGKQKIINGTGKYKGYFYTYMNCTPFTIQGNVLNGKMDGKWQLINSISLEYDIFNDSYYISNSSQVIGYEKFKEGLFIEGYSGDYLYNENQKIQIDGYCVNETIVFYENQTSCPGDKGVYFLQYEENILEETFYPNLLNLLSTTITSGLKNQWLIVGLNVNKEGILEKINVKSSIHDSCLEKQVYNCIAEMKNWNAEIKNNESIDSDLFFSILVRNNQIVIPKEYLHRNK